VSFLKKSFARKSFAALSFSPRDAVAPVIVVPVFPEYDTTEQFSRNTHGLFHLAMDRRRATRRGW
jgi:hypothetical protein